MHGGKLIKSEQYLIQYVDESHCTLQQRQNSSLHHDAIHTYIVTKTDKMQR